MSASPHFWIKYIWGWFFSECSELVHLSTLSAKQLKGTRKKENIKIKKTASCPHFHTFELLSTCLFSEFQSSCPPVHTFYKYFKGHKKERKYEIERKLLAHMSLLSNNEIHRVDFFSELIHLSTLFAKNLKKTRKKENMNYFWIMKTYGCQ